MNLQFYPILLLAITVVEIGCKKDPKNVILSADKTIVEKGQFVMLTTNWDRKAKWINFHIKKPNESNFSDNENGNVTGSGNFKLDSLGDYTFYAVAYVCSNNDDYDKLKKCKGQTKSNEINVAVITPCNECDSLYKNTYLDTYIAKLLEITDTFDIEPTQSMVNSSKYFAKNVSDNLICLGNFNNYSLSDFNLTKNLIWLQFDSTLAEEKRNDYIAFNVACDFFPVSYPGIIQLKNCPR